MCVDNKKLNKLTVKNRYPLPRSDDLIDRLLGATYFTKIDLRTGYHQIRIHPGHVYLTAFRTRYGHYEFLVLPFALTNAPTTFQQMMNDLFRDYLGCFVVVFLDDILVYSKTLEEHVIHLHSVLLILRQNKLYAKIDKCDFFKKEIFYLGHRISREGLSFDLDRIQEVLDWPVPQTVRQLHSFLGFTISLRNQ